MQALQEKGDATNVSPEAQAVVVRLRDMLVHTEPNPAFDALRNVVQERCEHDFSSNDGTVPTEYDGCRNCGTWYGVAMQEPTLRVCVLRDWTMLPKGSLVGALREVSARDFRVGTTDLDAALAVEKDLKERVGQGTGSTKERGCDIGLGKCVIDGREAVVMYPLLPGSPAFCSEHYNQRDAGPFGADFSGPDDFDIPDIGVA